MFELMDAHIQNAVIKVVGVGGGGGNTVNYMVDSNIEGVDFVCANTDIQALNNCKANTLLQLGHNITKGLGAGTNPDIGRSSAMEDRDRIKEVLEGADMIFLTAGLGGGTGTGASPVVAEVARDMGILTVAVVTMPFCFEGSKRMAVAEKGVMELAKNVDSIITIPNEKLLGKLGEDRNLLNAFTAANDLMLSAIQGIAGLITSPGLINVDFADVRAVMSEMGKAMVSSGCANGTDRARLATEEAIHGSLLEDINLTKARGILVNITAGTTLSIGEFDDVGSALKEIAGYDASVVVGTVIDPDMGDNLRVTVIATGLENTSKSITPGVTTDGLITSRPAESEEEDLDQLDYSSMDLPIVVRKDTKIARTYTDAMRDNDMESIDIPLFLRKSSDGDSVVKNKIYEAAASNMVKVVAPNSTTDEELAELIVHLSNVYRSIGGDELIVQGVKNIPPDNESSGTVSHSPKRRIAR